MVRIHSPRPNSKPIPGFRILFRKEECGRNLFPAGLQKSFWVFSQYYEERLDDPDRFIQFVRELGWDFRSDFPVNLIPDFGSVKSKIEAVRTRSLELEAAEGDIDRASAGLKLVHAVLELIGELKDIGAQIDTQSWPDTIDVGVFVIEFPRQLIHYLIVEYLNRHHGVMYALFRAIGVVKVTPIPSPGNILPSKRIPYTSRVVDVGRLSDFISDANKTVAQIYNWGDDQFDSQLLLDVLEALCVELEIPAGQYLPDPVMAGHLLGINDPNFVQMGRELRIPIYEVAREAGYSEAGVIVYPIPDKSDDHGNQLHPGFAVIPYLVGEAEEKIALGGNFALVLTGEIGAGIAIEVRPKQTTAKTGVFDSTELSMLQGEFRASVSRDPGGEAIRVFGEPDESHLTVGSISYTAGVFVDVKNRAELFVEVTLHDGLLAINPAEGDGFLQTILSRIDVEADFELTSGWSSEQSIYFRGSGSLEVVIPVHRSIGPLFIDQVYVGLSLPDIEALIAAKRQPGQRTIFSNISFYCSLTPIY